MPSFHATDSALHTKIILPLTVRPKPICGTECPLPLCPFLRPISTALHASVLYSTQALPYCSLTQQIRNDPTIRLLSYTQNTPNLPPSTTTTSAQSQYQQGWHIIGPTTAHHPTTTNRPPHCDDYTTALSCIPWDPLTQLKPLLTHHSYWHLSVYTHDVLKPTQLLTITLHDPFQRSGLKFYSKLVSFLTAHSLAYLPALTTKFRVWIRIWRTCSSSQHRTVPPRPATSDKNLLRPP